MLSSQIERLAGRLPFSLLRLVVGVGRRPSTTPPSGAAVVALVELGRWPTPRAWHDAPLCLRDARRVDRAAAEADNQPGEFRRPSELSCSHAGRAR